MDQRVSFGAWIKRRRKVLDLTQNALARTTGCAIGTIRKIEADERRPSRVLAERLADMLALSPHERTAFLQSARAELAPDHLPLPDAVGATRPAPALGADQRSHLQPQAINLPLPLVPLIGRAHERAAGHATLLAEAVRLLTVTGAPGIGKTRLSIDIARDLHAQAQWTVAFVALAPIRAAWLVPAAIAHVLGIKETDGQPVMDVLQAALRDRRMLLVLDNVEHVLEAAPLIAELLGRAPNLKVLATSRAPLHVYGEHEYALAPLALPQLAMPLVELQENAAVRLFVARAQAVNPAFALTPTNASAVAELCIRLDGLPLALELAATRSKLFPPDALLARLGQRLDLLTNGPRDRTPRQQTLRGALAWSYDLLDPPQQQVFRRVGVFVGGWTLEAAAAISTASSAAVPAGTAGSPPTESLGVDAVLAALLDHSLVQPVSGTEVELRFTLLETVRAYALEQLAAHGELARVHRAHAAYYCELAERAELALHGPQHVAWCDRLEQEHPNLRTALAWCAAHDVETGLRLAAAVHWFWTVRGYFTEGGQWLRALLSGADVDPADGHAAVVRAKALFAAAELTFFQMDLDAAHVLLDASLAAARGLGDQAQVIRSLGYLVAIANMQSDAPALRALSAEHDRLLKRYPDPLQATTQMIGRVHGGGYLDAAAARQVVEVGLATARAQGFVYEETQLTGVLGMLALNRGDVAAADHYGHAALALVRTLKDRRGIALCLNNLGEIARFQGDAARAGAYYAESLQLLRDLGNRADLPRLLHNAGMVALQQGNGVMAESMLAESLTRFQQTGSVRGTLEALAGYGALAVARGQWQRAARVFGTVEARWAGLGAQRWPADRAAYDQNIAMVQAHWAEPAVAAAWAAGQRLPLAQAVTATLEGEAMPA